MTTDPSANAFLRPGKLVLLVALGLFVYAAALIWQVPAGWLWQQARAAVALPPGVQVQQVSGTLWDGAAGLSVAGYPVRIDWQLGWPSLSDVSLPVDVSVTTARSGLSGTVRLAWPETLSLNASGSVAVAEFAELIRRSGGAMIEGDVRIDRLALTMADQRLAKADGLATWPGGRVTWPMGNQTGTASFPPMEARLSGTGNGINLEIAARGAEGPAADATVSANGMMDIRVYKRMVDLAGQPWPDAAQPGSVVFRVRQSLGSAL